MHPLGHAALLSSAMTALALDVTLILPASRPNPLTLASSTHATLTSLGQRFAAPISDTSTFVFRNVTPGSYLADVHCPSDGFRPLRVDVGGGGEVHAWETYRGNDWDNKGEAISMIETDTVKGFELSALGGKTYFTERPKCRLAHTTSTTVKANQALVSILSILMNPMILMGIVSMVFFVGMPKLVENSKKDLRWCILAMLTASALQWTLKPVPNSRSRKRIAQ